MSQTRLLDRDRSIVVVIDLQGKLLTMAHRWERVVAATVRLLKLADLFAVPVLLTEQYPEGLGTTHPEVRAVFDAHTGATDLLTKVSFGCCGDERFEARLAALRPGLPAPDRQVVIAGIEAHVCVAQTALELLTAGCQVHLCWECVSGRGEEYRHWALQRLQQAGAQITNHESVAFEWARTKDDDRFRAMNRLLREGQIV
ncbi:MAG: isochorismatase family protein [Acidobacteriota bacterium]